MNKVFCDICKKEVEGADVRYIAFYKMRNGKRVPASKTIECCAICLTQYHTVLNEYKGSHEYRNCKDADQS